VTDSRLTVAVTGIVTDSRLTVAVTGIVTDSTTEIGTFKLLSITKCKILSIGHEGIDWGVEVWLLSVK
jgi:hypothetical protein